MRCKKHGDLPSIRKDPCFSIAELMRFPSFGSPAVSMKRDPWLCVPRSPEVCHFGKRSFRVVVWCPVAKSSSLLYAVLGRLGRCHNDWGLSNCLAREVLPTENVA